VTRPDSNTRPAQTDAEFVAECRMPDALFASAFALAVRREVARRGGVPPQAVHAADRLPEEWGEPAPWRGRNVLLGDEVDGT
jgi:hypothetical protein